MNIDRTTVFSPTQAIEGDEVYATAIDGLFYIENDIKEDSRGFFVELAHIPTIENATGTQFVAQQVNLSSSRTGVTRGFHAEGWNKLVTVMSGTAYCVLVDLRPDSPSFLKKEAFLLGEHKDALHGSLFITQGIGNSVCAVEGPVKYAYVVDALYADRDTDLDRAISLFDPQLAVQWPFAKDEMIISKRDENGLTLDQVFPELHKENV